MGMNSVIFRMIKDIMSHGLNMSRPIQSSGCYLDHYLSINTNTHVKFVS